MIVPISSDRSTARRQHGRIYFGEGAEQWSVTDPEHDQEHEGQFTQRDLASEWLYMIQTCPGRGPLKGR